MDLMGIGEFARLSRLSPKALRLYDESGLLAPAQVDPESGYRWYAAEQLDQARLVASLRQIGVPLARISAILESAPPATAGLVAEYWSGVESEHAARRELAGHLVNRLHGKKYPMNEVEVRDIPARSLLCLLRHVRPDELLPFGKAFMARFMGKGLLVEGIGGAPFVIYHGEVSEDGDGPIEWCWPVAEDRAAALAADHPDLLLRTEPAHQEAFVHQGMATQLGEAQTVLAIESIYSWVLAHQRKPTGAARQVFISNPANGVAGPDCDFAVPLH